MEVIKRDNGSMDEIEFSLRIINLDNNICNRLKKNYSHLFPIEINNIYEDKNKALILIENIDENLNYLDIVKIINEFKIDKNHINIFIALTTECDISGFTVPQKISDLHSKIGGSIDFSIINYESK